MLGRMTPPESLLALRATCASMAQMILDEWQQDADGMDPLLGAGGACDLVASAICAGLCDAGVEAIVTGTEFDGGHAFVHALVDGVVWSVDIPARIYETGYGYVWTKRPGVVLTPDDAALLAVATHTDASTFADTFSG